MSMPWSSISGVFLAFCFHVSNWKVQVFFRIRSGIDGNVFSSMYGIRSDSGFSMGRKDGEVCDLAQRQFKPIGQYPCTFWMEQNIANVPKMDTLDRYLHRGFLDTWEYRARTYRRRHKGKARLQLQICTEYEWTHIKQPEKNILRDSLDPLLILTSSACTFLYNLKKYLVDWRILVQQSLNQVLQITETANHLQLGLSFIKNLSIVKEYKMYTQNVSGSFLNHILQKLKLIVYNLFVARFLPYLFVFCNRNQEYPIYLLILFLSRSRVWEYSSDTALFSSPLFIKQEKQEYN